MHVSLAMYGDFSLFRAGFSEWFQELFRLLPFLVKIHIFYRAITGNELTGLARRHPGIPIVQINSCYASAGLPPLTAAECPARQRFDIFHVFR